MDKKLAILTYWNSTKKFGFAETRQPVTGGGNLVQQYYIHRSQIVFSVPDEPRVGCVVRFTVSPKPPRLSTDKPFAENIEVFETQEQVDTYVTATAGRDGVK